jgi:hypothetical protein
MEKNFKGEEAEDDPSCNIAITCNTKKNLRIYELGNNTM